MLQEKRKKARTSWFEKCSIKLTVNSIALVQAGLKLFQCCEKALQGRQKCSYRVSFLCIPCSRYNNQRQQRFHRSTHRQKQLLDHTMWGDQPGLKSEMEKLQSFQKKFARKIKLGKISFSEALKCTNWLPMAGRRLSRPCIAVENAIKGKIPQHFESFKSTLRSSHGYNTRNGSNQDCLNPKRKEEKRVSYFRFTNDWMSLPVFLKKPMPCAIFKKNLTRFLMDKYV